MLRYAMYTIRLLRNVSAISKDFNSSEVFASSRLHCQNLCIGFLFLWSRLNNSVSFGFFHLIFSYSAHFLRKEWVTFIFAPSSLSDDFFSSNICVSTCTPIVRFASIACFPIFCFFRAVVAAKIDLLVASFARVAASLLICSAKLPLEWCVREQIIVKVISVQKSEHVNATDTNQYSVDFFTTLVINWLLKEIEGVTVADMIARPGQVSRQVTQVWFAKSWRTPRPKTTSTPPDVLALNSSTPLKLEHILCTF